MTYTSFTVRHFRCFDDLTVEGLGRVNLISGMNNVGKTAFLEAMTLHAGFASPAVVGDLHAIRGGEENVAMSRDTWEWLFTGRGTDSAIELVSTDTDGVERKVTVTKEPSHEFSAPRPPASPTSSVSTADTPVDFVFRYEDSLGRKGNSLATVSRSTSGTKPSATAPVLSTTLTTPRDINPRRDAGLLSEAVERNEDGDLVQLLRTVDDRIRGLLTLVKGNQPVVYVDIEGAGRVPLWLLGSGPQRLLSFALRVRSNRVVLVDEIDNGVHHAALKEMWASLARLATRYDAQIIATTHSLECIRAAAAGLADVGGARLYRFERRKGRVVVVSLSPDVLMSTVKFDMEVR